MKLLFILFLTISIQQVYSKEKVVGIFYLNQMFGHVHSKSDSFSSSLSTLACGHPVKVIRNRGTYDRDVWFYVKVAGVKGYIKREFLQQKRPSCFQSKYPKYFNALNLDLNELYYWGRLSDHFVEGESKVK